MRPRLLSFAPTAGVAALLVMSACQAPTGAGSTSASASESASASASASEAAAGAEVKVAHTTAGDALVGKDGKTLYFFAKDTSGTSTCTGGCANNWPAFTLGAGETATAGSGVTASWLATVKRSDGSTQVTYNGHPLYYFAGDKAAGDANGQGISGIWFIATANGKLPSPSAKASASATASMGY
jgi:predicted lipoprotein with Yx(FWY)xxD motif